MTIVIDRTNSNFSTTDIGLYVTTPDDIVVLPNGLLGSTLYNGIRLQSFTFSNTVYVYGTVLSTQNTAITLPDGQSGGSIGINSMGFVGGGNGIAGYGYLSNIFNHGTIKGYNGYGIDLGAGGTTIDNYGQILGNLSAINIDGPVASWMVVNNYAGGFIGNISNAFNGVAIQARPTTYTQDTINNAGRIYGDINLGAARDDVRVTGDGVIDGKVFMGDASDTVTISGNGRINGRVDLGADADTYTGGAQRDEVYGGTGADTILGNGGGDFLMGYTEADTIRGGAGADNIVGGLGRDSMMGGSVLGGNDGARDYFFYNAISDTGNTFATADFIWDFNAGTAATADRISLVAIDARAFTLANEAFTWIGTAAFSGASGELRQQTVSGYTMVTGDVNGDKVADFAININGIKTLAATDFLL
jgi:Ca2+-binding RTX toxin-like protein